MDAFIGEIRPFAFGFVPQGWLLCAGQELAISQQQILFSVISNIYGGNGTTTFKLPNLMGLTPVGSGTDPVNGANWVLGATQGAAQVALTTSQIPQHNHVVHMESISVSAVQTNMSANPVANSSWLSHPVTITGPDEASLIPNFTPPSSGNLDSTLSATTIGASGTGAGHENRQPFLAVQYCICVDGTYPQHP